jgi:predicted nuclease of restriction endonuclease-like (RecB) superfamily
VEGNWSRSWLEDQIAARLFKAQGSAITNFDTTLPANQSHLAKELLKDEYNLEFLTMKARYDEHDLEEALVNNITRFLLELGKGFAYVGRQMELRMDEETAFFPDLVFYHIPQKRYVIIELKAVKFMPEFAGKLNFYVTAADKLLRGVDDNPSVGLLICKTAKKTIVEWSLQDIQKPLGVATYQLQEVVERTIAELESNKKHKG